ncbi:MAG: dihydroorotase [Aquificaceae bacterium]|nr:MAG: dihydroorotase [Aquificaceae bacterium]
MTSLHIKSARLIDPANQQDTVTDVYINDGVVLAIGEAPANYKNNKVIDADGLWLLPGIVDLSVYLREPGQENKATIQHEMNVAIRSGITTVCAMPEPLSPIDSSARINLINEKAQAAKATQVEIIGALMDGLKGEQLSNMGGLKKAGCVAVSQGLEPIHGLNLLRKSMEYAATLDLKLFYQPIEHSLLAGGCAHEGAIATRLGLPPISTAVETTAMAQMLMLVEETNTSVHFCRLSCAKSVELLKQAKAKGLPVTADVAAHQLFLTEMDISDFNTLCNTLPPLRSERDRDALREGVATGVIDAICSDHQPHDIDAKLSPFQQSSTGISALETLLPLTLRLVEEGVISLQQAISCVTHKSAAIINKSKGSLAIGQVADFVLFDPTQYLDISLDTFQSKGKNSPFFGWNFNGRVVSTAIAGNIIFHQR